METLETRSACRHRGSTLALRSSLSLWVRLDLLIHTHIILVSTPARMNGKNLRLMLGVHRTHLLHLPHLLPPNQHRLLPHLLYPRLRLWLPRGRVLESRARVRECREYDGCDEGWTARRCKVTPSCPPIPSSLLSPYQNKKHS